MNSRKKYTFSTMILILMLVGLAIGYAALTANLTINGSSSIKNASWDVHFENVVVDENSVSASAPVIDNNKTTVTFDVTLHQPGDLYQFTVDVKNDGTVDAMIEDFEIVFGGPSNQTFLSYGAAYADGSEISEKQELLSGAKETIVVYVEFLKDISSSELPTSDQTFTFTLSITYVQKDDSSIPMYRPISFATDSWATIHHAISKNNTSLYHVGDTKQIDLGTYGVHTVRIANMSDPEECNDGSFSQTACGFVVEFADIITNHTFNSTNTNVGGWQDSEIRTFLNTDIFNALPDDLKDILSLYSTMVVSGHGNNTGEGNFTTQDHLYLLSNKEINYNISNDTAGNNTRVLDYYAGGENSTRIKQYNGSNAYWWTRTAHSSNNVSIFCVGNTGSNSGNVSSYNRGVSPAFQLVKPNA